jgi:Uma2 family endonuclease
MAGADTEIVELGPNSNGTVMTPWEFDGAEFEPGWRYELVNGVLIVNPPPLMQERDPNEELGHRLRTYQESHPEGAKLNHTVSEQTVNVGPTRRRVDRAIWAGLGRLPRGTETPTITVEFVSSGKRNRHRDYELKRDEYHLAGVLEYWIVDRFRRTMTVFLFKRDKMTERVVEEGATYTTPLLPGFELSVGDFLALADRWDDTDAVDTTDT